MVGYGIEEQLPTVAVVAHYDAFGVAPVIYRVSLGTLIRHLKSNRFKILLAWLSVRQRITDRLATIVHKCLHGLAPPYSADDVCLSQLCRAGDI